MCWKTASRRSRVTYSCSDAPSCPAIQTKRFLTTITMPIATITAPSASRLDRLSRNRPMSELRRRLTKPMSGIAVAFPSSLLRNGMSSVKENPSSAAAMMLQRTLPARRHQCGRRNWSSRAYTLPPRRQQRHRQNALLRRDAAMQERAAIAARVLPELRWIDEERVSGRQQRIRAESTPRKLERILVRELQRVFGILGT